MELNTKPTEELLQILKEGSRVHSEQTIMDVEVILQERDVQYYIPYKKSKKKTKQGAESLTSTVENKFIFAPILVALVFLFLPFVVTFLRLGSGLNPDQVFYINIGYIIGVRVIVLAIVDHYNGKLNISGPFWYILGLVFGSLSLIIYNIYLWIKLASIPQKNDEIIDSLDELE